MADILGTVGVALILVAYILVQIRRLIATEAIFSLLNFIGAGLILFSLVFNWNTPAVLMEGTWMLVSFWGTLRALYYSK